MSCIKALVMAFVFYVTINVVTTINVNNSPLGDIDPNRLTIYEGILLWSNQYACTALSVLFCSLALLNVPFSCFICFEQVMILYRELASKAESIRVEKYLTLRNRTFFNEELGNVVEKPQLMREEYSNTARNVVISLILLFNACLYYAGPATFVIALIGSTTSPGCIFVLPGLLFFSNKTLFNGGSIHRTLSKALYTSGWLLMVVMTSMSIFAQRSDMTSRAND